MAKVKKRKETYVKRIADQADRSSAYFLRMEVANHRSFGSIPQTLNLSDAKGAPARWTIILGENGTGKTTLLQALLAFEDTIQFMRAAFFSESGKNPIVGPVFMDFDPFREVIPLPFKPSTSLKLWFASGSDLNSKINSQFNNCWHFGISNGKDLFEDYNEDNNIINVIPGDSKVSFPVCYAYGAGRRLTSSTLAPDEDEGTRSLYFDDANLRNAEEWLLRTDYASKTIEGPQSQRDHLEKIKQLLIDILPDVDEIRFGVTQTRYPSPMVEFHTPYGWVTLRDLGYGYRTLIAWMVDFASRMVDRYPVSNDPLAEPAVVLVDEIDLHLHPTWQRTLISHLSGRFPKTQFIVTAHSPLIVQSAAGANANIVLLRRDGDHVIIDNDTEIIRGWRIDQILTSDLFGLPSARPPDIEESLKRKREILAKPKLTKRDRDELKNLEKKIGSLPVGDSAEQAKKMMELVEESQRLIRKSREGTQ